MELILGVKGILKLIVVGFLIGVVATLIGVWTPIYIILGGKMYTLLIEQYWPVTLILTAGGGLLLFADVRVSRKKKYSLRKEGQRQ